MKKSFEIRIDKKDIYRPFFKFRKGTRVFRNKEKDIKRLRQEFQSIRNKYIGKNLKQID